MLIGFAIASHEANGKLERLIRALNNQYGSPPIAVHHDFGQAALDTAAFPANVRFVIPHGPTSWSAWPTVRAALRAIDLLYSDQRPDWFFFLSAADYPVMRGDEARRELANTPCDAFVDFWPLEQVDTARAAVIGENNPKLSHFGSEGNKRLKWRFYKARQFWIPIIRSKPRLRIGKYTWRPPITAPNPYSEAPCFYGDFWFAGRARVADILRNPTAWHLKVQHHLRNRTQVDESYIQTVLVNEPSLTICRDNRRFAEWNGGGRSPMDLTLAQIDEMLASGAFFARKFSAGEEVTAMIDERLSRLLS